MGECAVPRRIERPAAYRSALYMDFPDPETELMPGVKWGRPEWVPSAAFWALTAARASQHNDGFVARDANLREQVGFCLLGGYGISAEVCHAFYDVLQSAGCFLAGNYPSPVRIEQLLRQAVPVGNQKVRYRFPFQRARRISVAMATLETEWSEAPRNVSDFRRKLMQIDGIGPKTSSWVARNWLGSDEVAILDIHVLRAGLLINLFNDRLKLPKDYFNLERRFLEFCAALGTKPSLLDAVIWRTMRRLGRTVVLTTAQSH